ncbi:nitrite reductase large subunit NirB [Cohnella zeiphila]|uniref:NAD(P)/FAD-dependent oxidoreductase n=1 Tax=Cohnella zeiphila TaxID=2761120 RepID=A0A7X0VV45_9BACL|nr:nitrite reductase large subunit NirB [Cohnella zeiphila]MBB6731035.1 NAD(P)/FAD-dependent oxidoreductase [Cohnella zeiphila]
MEKPRLVVVGNGMAGVRCVEEIYRLEPERFDITIIGAEPSPNYNRILLSKVLQGDASFDDIVLNPWEWYEERGIRLMAGDRAVRVDPDEKRVETASGASIGYDKLLLATGSSAFVPPLPGAGKPGVIAFRTLADCRAMIEAAGTFRRAAVIGGGLLGLEAARGLLNLGMEVDVVHNAPYLMNRQLDRTAADLLRKELEEQGMRFHLGKTTERIVGRRRAEGLAFSDGTRLRTDLIVVAVGIRPNVELGKSSGVFVNRAFVVNDYLETNVPDVYAVGECAEHDGIVYGLVAPLYEQGKVLAAVLCGRETPPYRGSVPYAQLKVSGVDVFSAGSVQDGEAEVAFQQYDGIRGTYKKLTAVGGKLAGVVLFGDTGEGNVLLGHLKRRADVAVLQGSAASGQADDGGGAAAAMADHETVCNCNGVSKGAIALAVREHGLNTVEQVRDRTKASGSCGGCKPLVAAVLRLAASGAGGEAAAEPAVCGCTSLGHAALRAALSGGAYANAAQAMRALGWRSEGGCAACRPAIRYYLGSAETAAASGEKAGADRTAERVTLMPRLPGGLVEAARLRSLAEAAERYGVPYVRLTEAARLELAEVPAELARRMAEEAGVPMELARSGDHTARVYSGAETDGGERELSLLGADLERRLGSRRLPHAVTVAVVSALGEKAGLAVRDLGLARAPAGWELHAGGRAEPPLRPAKLLTVEPDGKAAMAAAAACLQLYRDSAAYGEPLWKWLERIGLTAVREKLLDPDEREELLMKWNGGADPIGENGNRKEELLYGIGG